MNESTSLNKTIKAEDDKSHYEFSCDLYKIKCIKPLPKDLAKLALYIVCISDLSSIIQASYDLASSITVSTIFVIFSVICSFFGLLGLYSITTANKDTMKVYAIYTYVRLLLETFASFGMSFLFYLYHKNQMYDDNLPIWIVFFINSSCLTVSRIAFSYVAYSFLQGIKQADENLIAKANIV